MRNNPADTKISEGGAPGARADTPITCEGDHNRAGGYALKKVTAHVEAGCW